MICLTVVTKVIVHRSSMMSQRYIAGKHLLYRVLMLSFERGDLKLGFVIRISPVSIRAYG